MLQGAHFPVRPLAQREREMRSLRQLIAHRNPPPSTVPVPMAVPKGFQVGVSVSMLIIARKLKPSSASRLRSQLKSVSSLASPASSCLAGESSQ